MGEHLGYSLIQSDLPIDRGFKLVKLENDKRVGLYLNKIVLAHEKDLELENLIKDISGPGLSLSHLAGVYILESKGLSESIDIIASLKEKVPNLSVDLDIRYNRISPK